MITEKDLIYETKPVEYDIYTSLCFDIDYNDYIKLFNEKKIEQPAVSGSQK